MSDAEAIMWAVDKDPALRSDFTNVTVLDRPPDEGRLRAKLTDAMAEIPRLAQRVVTPPLRIAPPEWRHDPTLDLDYHLRKIALPPPGGLRELLDLAAIVSAAPLDRSRPLWEFTLVQGLEGGRAALIQKLHHTITDGVGGLRLSLSVVDLERDPAPAAPPEPSPARAVAVDVAAQDRRRIEEDPIDRTSPLDVVADAVGFAVRQQVGLARRGLGAVAHLLAHPDDAPRLAEAALAMAGSIRRQVLMTEPGRSSLFAPRSLGRRFEVFSRPLDDARRAAKALGGSVNDLYVCGVAGALGLYHERMGMPVDELRMAMPVSIREGRGDGAANRFAPTRVVVPVEPKDPAERFVAVRDRLAGVRQEPALAAADSLTAVLALLPTSVLVTATRSQARTIDFAASNLRGSPVELYVGGATIEANYPMGPRVGCPLNVTLLSYGGQLHMGLNLDPAAVTDPRSLLECFEESFDALLESAGAPAGS